VGLKLALAGSPPRRRNTLIKKPGEVGLKLALDGSHLGEGTL